MSADERYRRGYEDGMLDGANKLAAMLRGEIETALGLIEESVDKKSSDEKVGG